ncbi:SRPBCC family protein [Longispora sp. NPDC051575]|uniref:SRPBCC family protein n=1 Tax=Longispora sp. NPDC051575 TaxID=3154943 RepID=UPI003431ADC3
MTIPLALAAVAGTTLPAGAAGGSTAAPSAAAGQPRPLTCRGEGVDPAARIRYRTEVMIEAPLRTVWGLQTTVRDWPSWQPPVTSARRLDPGPLREGSRFRWTTPVPATPGTPATTLVITSTVRQAQYGRCLRWTGPAIGEGLRIDQGTHVWTFTEVDGGVLVRTEETWVGAQVEADVPTSTAYLGMGLEDWLRNLKTTAEARHHSN